MRFKEYKKIVSVILMVAMIITSHSFAVLSDSVDDIATISDVEKTDEVGEEQEQTETSTDSNSEKEEPEEGTENEGIFELEEDALPIFLGSGNSDVKNEEKTLANVVEDKKTNRRYIDNEVIVLRDVTISDDTNSKKMLGARFDEFETMLDEAEVIVEARDVAVDVDDKKMLGVATNDNDSKEVLYVKSDKYSTNKLIENLSKIDSVVSVEPNYVFKLDGIDDSYEEENNVLLGGSGLLGSGDTLDLTSYQYAYKDDYDDEKYKYSIKVPNWNDKTKKNATDSIIAVIDTGIDVENEDLKNVMWADGLNYSALTDMGGGKYGFNAIAGSSIDATGTEVSTDPTEKKHYHGTHCAGIIAAEWNDIGVSGVCNGAKIMAIKAANYKGETTVITTIKGLNYALKAKQAGVNVVCTNNSYGGEDQGTAYQYIVTKLGEAGVASIFASGNEFTNLDKNLKTSVGFRQIPYTIVVNNSNNVGRNDFTSNSGKVNTDLSAPGMEILSTLPKYNLHFDNDEKYNKAPYKKSVFTEGLEDSGFFKASNISCDGNITTTADEDYTSIVYDDVSDTATTTFSCDGFTSVETSTTSELYLDLTIGMEMRATATLNFYVPAKECDSAGNYTDSDIVYIKASFSNISLDAGTFLEDFGQITINLKEIMYDGGKTYKPYLADYDGGGVTKHFNVVMKSEVRSKDDGKPILNDYTLLLKTINIYNIDPPAYGLKSGTSMSCPTVAGIVGIVAAKYKSEGPAKWVARIKGSVATVSTIADPEGAEELITSENTKYPGIANVANAIDDNYIKNPVINSVATTSNGYKFDGFFFGSNTGNIVVGDTDITDDVTSWSDEEIVVVTDKDIEGSVQEVKITTTDNKKGRNFFNIQRVKSTDTTFCMPSISGFNYFIMQRSSMVATNSDIYFMNANEDNNVIYDYDTIQKSWTELSTINSITYLSDGYEFSNDAVYLNHKIYYPCIKSVYNVESDRGLGVYDIESGTFSFHHIDFKISTKLSDYTIFAYNNKIYIIGGSYVAGNSTYGYDNVLEIDTDTFSTTWLDVKLPVKAECLKITKGFKDSNNNTIFYVLGGDLVNYNENKEVMYIKISADNKWEINKLDTNPTAFYNLIENYMIQNYIPVENGFYLITTDEQNIKAYDVPKGTVTDHAKILDNVVTRSFSTTVGDTAYAVLASVLSDDIVYFKTFNAPSFEGKDPKAKEEKKDDPVTPSSGGGSSGGGSSSIIPSLNAVNIPNTLTFADLLSYTSYAMPVSVPIEFNPLSSKFKFPKYDAAGNKSYAVNEWVLRTNELGKQEIYLTDANGDMCLSYQVVGNRVYYFSTDLGDYGQMKKGFTNINGQIIYFDEKYGYYADSPEKFNLMGVSNK